ncbi:MAG: lipoate--protein ligase [Oscillospiraceae bacterium]|nr:lipoate--protein ligase [Oscillospiraceae bacterium]
MLIIYNRSTDPAYNLAMEEYMLDRKSDDIIMLWRNSDAVIIGRNQNAIEEMNLDYIKEHNITVIRRLTGGGAVFHDLGNLNFTFIKKNQEGMFNDYSGFTRPVRDYLRTLGVNCELSGRNDILVDGMKVSGNAQTVRKGRIMHHGTLLFSADISRLSGALKVREVKAESRGIKSYRSRVANIYDCLEKKMSIEEFTEGLLAYFCEKYADAEFYEISKKDIAEVEKLVAEKYGKWEWNFGEAPKYNYRNSKKYPFGVVDLYIQTENSKIEAITINGDYFGVKDISEAEGKFVGVLHRYEDIFKMAEEIGIDRYISGMAAEDFARLATE